MTGKGLICKLGKHIEIPGADKIVQVDMFGETIITQKTNSEGLAGILFDMETCLTHEFASKNNMYRHSHLNQDKTVTGYLEDDRRIRPIKLKGVKVSGLWMPIQSLYGLTTTMPELKYGQEIDSIFDIKICEKYISKATKSAMNSSKGGKVKLDLAPTFKEHIDTDQWARNSHKVQEGDLVIITEKLHGTSGRCGYLQTIKPQNLWQKFTHWLGHGIWGRNILSYNFVVGSRRVVKSIGGNEAENKAHFYEEDLWTKVAHEFFEGKLHKGETVYFEIIGYTPSGELIMSSVSNKKLEKFLSKEEYKAFIDRYGENTTFNYGCTQPIFNTTWADGGKEYADLTNAYKIFVYRITMTNEDGNSIDYSWEQVKRRCDELNVNHVPELSKDLITSEILKDNIINTIVQDYTNAESKEFPQHIREGVCIRIENGAMTPLLLKEKSYIFKVLEGIIKDTDVVDLEESN